MAKLVNFCSNTIELPMHENGIFLVVCHMSALYSCRTHDSVLAILNTCKQQCCYLYMT